jgi:opacity protein-like surface antigen
MALSGTVLANTMGAVNSSDHWRPVVALGGGPAWTNPGENQTFYLQPDVQKGYVASKSTQHLASGEFLLGLQKTLNPYLTGQFGLTVVDASEVKLNGNILEDADPDFNNFSYIYRIKHTSVGLKGRLIGNAWYGVQPYISGSIGLGFNRACDFSMTPKISEEVSAPGFISNTKTAFSYSLGAGIQKSLSPNWQVGVGYEFADWGSYDLDRAAGQTMNHGLSLNNVYIQQLQFSVIYTY